MNKRVGQKKGKIKREIRWQQGVKILWKGPKHAGSRASPNIELTNVSFSFPTKVHMYRSQRELQLHRILLLLLLYLELEYCKFTTATKSRRNKIHCINNILKLVLTGVRYLTVVHHPNRTATMQAMTTNSIRSPTAPTSLHEKSSSHHHQKRATAENPKESFLLYSNHFNFESILPYYCRPTPVKSPIKSSWLLPWIFKQKHFQKIYQSFS